MGWSANTGCGTTPVTSGNPGVATCTTSSLAVGTDAISAAYSGDSNHGANTGTLNQVVNQASTSAIVISSLNPSTYGQAVSFSANVAALAPGAGTPTGTVQFVVDGGNFGSPVMLAAGSATSSSISTLTEGAHSVSAIYSGDSNFSASSSATLGQTVNQASAATTVTSSQNPSVFGQSITLTATINGQFGLDKRKGGGAHPQDVSGSVTWSVNTGCGTTPVTMGNPGAATCITSSLPAGTDTITATYSGDSNHSASTGTLNQVVNQASTSAIVISSLNPSTYGQAVSFSANVAVLAPGAGNPSGTVQFVVDGGNFGSPVSLSGGSANSGSISTLTEGTHTVSAIYSGNSNFSASSAVLAAAGPSIRRTQPQLLRRARIPRPSGSQ